MFKNELLFFSLKNFFTQSRIETILPILNGKSSISLRLLDWFVTNYSKQNSTTVLTDDGTYKIVYFDYKSQLKAFSKKQFDPFCRRERINFPYKKTTIETTIGQLNFFRWVLQNNLLPFLETNWSLIEEDMNNTKKTQKDSFSSSAQFANVHGDIKIVLNFE